MNNGQSFHNWEEIRYPLGPPHPQILPNPLAQSSQLTALRDRSGPVTCSNTSTSIPGSPCWFPFRLPLLIRNAVCLTQHIPMCVPKWETQVSQISAGPGCRP